MRKVLVFLITLIVGIFVLNEMVNRYFGIPYELKQKVQGEENG
jgi:hypothetical protein